MRSPDFNRAAPTNSNVMRLTVMQKNVMATSTPLEGFLLLDSSMKPIFVNPVAAQILVYPEKPETQRNLDSCLASRIRLTLFSEQSSNGSALVPEFESGRRTYRCRSFHVNGMANGDSRAAFAVLLERASSKSASLAQLFERFHLTTREQEVAQFLLHGLTSKEIGVRMQISPNTVKAFLRLIMVKMGVSTRSGIVGKALTMEL
jgi:DNA-binding CsgD family transcriptional regulator